MGHGEDYGNEVPISQTFHGKNEGELLEVKNADFGKMRIELVYVNIFQGNSMGRKFIWPYFIEFHWALGFEIWKPVIAPGFGCVPETPKATTFHRLTQMYMYNVYINIVIYIGIMYMLYVDPKCMLGIIY